MQSKINKRIILKNLLYVINLPDSLSTEISLRDYNHFGQYGLIKKISIKSKPFISRKAKVYSAYITYSNSKEASVAILAVDGLNFSGTIIRASYGTTKYCNYFLNGVHCLNQHCLFLHHLASPTEEIDKDDFCSGSSIFRFHKSIAREICKEAKISIAPCMNSNGVMPRIILKSKTGLIKSIKTNLHLFTSGMSSRFEFAKNATDNKAVPEYILHYVNEALSIYPNMSEANEVLLKHQNDQWCIFIVSAL